MLGTSAYSPISTARSDAMGYLHNLIVTCEKGRPDPYWLHAARDAVRSYPQLRAEFVDIFVRAAIWGDAAHRHAKATAAEAESQGGGASTECNQPRSKQYTGGADKC